MNDYVRNKWVYGLIWLAVIAITIWVITGTNSGQEDDVKVNQETYTIESSVQESTVQETEAVEGYYIVKSENETVKVYWVDETGEHLHRETSIAYPLLNLEDQNLLDKGIRLETDEELSDFLENYDS